jgi:hypothetical protein
MATTTPNYGWTVPTSGDLVKDGATAIETLGDAIDASMNTALGTKKAGMVLLNTTSFSGVASTSLAASTFTSTYDNYKIKVTSLFASSSSNNMSARLRKAGVDNSDSNSYRRMGFVSDGSSLGNSSQTTNILYVSTLNSSSTAPAYLEIDLYLPFVNNQTGFNILSYRADNDSAVTVIGRHTTVDTFDSLSFSIATGTFSGTYSVYGYNK